jgi:hypothetical protein
MAHVLVQEATFETLYTFPIESHWHASLYFQTVWPKVTRDYVNDKARGWTALYFTVLEKKNCTVLYFTVLETETRCQKFVHPLRESFHELDSLYLKKNEFFFPEDGGSRFLGNDGNNPVHYTLSYPRWLQSELFLSLRFNCIVVKY